MDRYNRIAGLLEGELITITNIEKYKSLIEDITEEQFEVHVEALKEMTSDGNSYEFTPVEKDGTLTLDIKEIIEEKKEDESTEEKKEDESTEEKSEDESTEEKKEDEIEDEIEEKKEDNEEKKEKVTEKKSEFSELNIKLAQLLDLVQSGQSRYESFEGEFKDFKDTMTKSFKVLKKKQKELQDNEYNISKALSLENVIRKSTGNEKVSLKEDIGNILADKCTELYKGRAIEEGEKV